MCSWHSCLWHLAVIIFYLSRVYLTQDKIISTPHSYRIHPWILKQLTVITSDLLSLWCFLFRKISPFICINSQASHASKLTYYRTKLMLHWHAFVSGDFQEVNQLCWFLFKTLKLPLIKIKNPPPCFKNYKTNIWTLNLPQSDILTKKGKAQVNQVSLTVAQFH